MDGALQEADESALWLELLHEDCGIKTDTLLRLLSETNELVAILVTIVEKTKRRAA
jgi:four helix bundle protein